MTAVVGISDVKDTQAVAQPLAKPTAPLGQPVSAKPDGSFGFADFIDVINPLQHIPGVSDLYRAVTNDQISEEAQQTGKKIYGFALGGPIGVGVMMAYDALKEQSASKIAETDNAEEMGVANVAAPAASSVSVMPDSLSAEGTTLPRSDNAQSILGETVAATGQRSAGQPLDLSQFWGAGASMQLAEQTAPSSKPEIVPEKGRVSMAPITGTGEMSSEPVVPDVDALDRLAAHKSNHLSLDVLKALQERHAKLSAPQQS